MFTIERKIIDRLLEYKFQIMFLCISVLGLYIRFRFLSFRSYDYNTFLGPWYDEIRAGGGVNALKKQVGNYGLTYQTLISIFTYLPGKSIFWYKTLSIAFDFVLAIVGGKIVAYLQGNRGKKFFVFTYSILLFTPTIIINSGMWGQCDSIYTSFILLCFLLMLKNKYKSVFISLGIAFAFKLQTIFFVPFVLLYYLTNKRYSILNFLLSIFSFYICCLPGIMIRGNLFAPFEIYNDQTKETRINLNIPNFSGLLSTSSLMENGNIYRMMKVFLICITIAILMIAYLYFINKKSLSNSKMLEVAAWTCWTCVMFLPTMHDRYMYVADVFLILLMSISKKYILNTSLALFVSYLTYLYALLNIQINIFLLSIIALFNYLLFSFLVIFSEKSIIKRQ